MNSDVSSAVAESTNWRTVTVDEIKADGSSSIAIGPFGSRMKANTYVSEGVPVIRGSNIGDTRKLRGDFVYIPEALADTMRSSLLHTGDLFFPHRGLIGEVGIVEDGVETPCMLSTSLMKLSPDPRLADARFLFYFFRSPRGRHELLRNSSQVGTPGIATPLSSLRRVTLALPPLGEQRSIARLLSAFDDKIDSNLRLTGLLEDVAAMSFRARFVDFVGVEEFQETEIGLVPQGWQVVPLCDAVEINPRVSIRKGSIVPYIEMAAVEPWATRPTTTIERPYSGGARFEPGDTLMARITGCIEHGKGAFIDFLDGPGSGSTEFLVLRARAPLTAEAVFFLSRVERVRAHAIASMTGSSGRQRVQTAAFRDLKVAVPPDSASWRDEASVMSSCLRQSKALWSESATLRRIRDALLPKLISGQIRVPDTTGPAQVIEPALA